MNPPSTALHSFITQHRDELLTRARARVARRREPRATKAELERGVPLFLSQLIELLRERMTREEESAARTSMDETAGVHGQDLFANGLTIAQVVNDYGDVCQAITSLAIELRVPITAEEFRDFNRCLDDAIAHAVTAYEKIRDHTRADEGAVRMSGVAHEMRNVLSTAMLSFDMIKGGKVGADGAVGAMLARSLVRLNELIERSLVQESHAAQPLRREPIALAALIAQTALAAGEAAREKGVAVEVAAIDPAFAVELDRGVLFRAMLGLLQSAIARTGAGGSIALRVRASGARIFIEVVDQAGGVPQGEAEELFRGRPERGEYQLSSSRAAIEGYGGELRAADHQSRGCCFTIELPRLLTPPVG